MSASGSDPTSFRSVLLLGSDHTNLGDRAIEEVAPSLALGISRGRFPKGYPHVDANEDAVYAGTDGSTTIVVVADGHGGFNAARAAMSAIATAAPPAIGGALSRTVERLAAAATDGVANELRDLPPPRRSSGSSLTIAAIRESAIAAATVGDTACFVATHRRTTRIGKNTAFLVADTNPASIHVASTEIPRGCAVVVTSDGLLDFTRNTDRLLRSTSTLASHDGVERLLDAAFDGGAGDNLSIGIHRPE